MYDSIVSLGGETFYSHRKALSKIPGLLQVAIAVAGGQVSVEGTVIMGGPKAVSVMNPLRKLGNTRVLYHQSKLVFWFCVQ